MFFKEMAESKNGVFVGNNAAKAIKSKEFLETESVVNGFFEGRVAEIVPKLEKMKAEHQGKWVRVAAFFAFIIRS